MKRQFTLSRISLTVLGYYDEYRPITARTEKYTFLKRRIGPFHMRIATGQSPEDEAKIKMILRYNFRIHAKGL